MNLLAQSSPTPGLSGSGRLYAETNNGFTRVAHINELGTPIIMGRDASFVVRNTTGNTLTKGQVVYVNGSTGNIPNVALAKADAITTLPSLGMVLENIANNGFGYVMVSGVISNINTSVFISGDILYVSSSVAGGVQNTRPVSPLFANRIGTVLVSGVGNGSIEVKVAPFVGGVETGTVATPWTGQAVVATTFNGGTLSGNNSGDQTLAGLGGASAGALASHEADATLIHGIVDTSVLETVGGSQSKVTAHAVLTTGVHGVGDGTIAKVSDIPGAGGIVTPESEAGLTHSVGIASSWSRADHTHGTPPLQTTVSGNAGTAITLQTARDIGGRSFNGSADIIAPTAKCGIATRNVSLASEVVNVAHGLGRVPSLVRVKASLITNSTVTQECHGSYDGTNHVGLSTKQYEGAGTVVSDAIFSSIVFELGFASAYPVDPYVGANRQNATITCDATNIIFTWTRTGTLTSVVANILWECS